MAIQKARIVTESIDISGLQSFTPPPTFIILGQNLPTETQFYTQGAVSRYGQIIPRKSGQIMFDSEITKSLFCAVETSTFTVLPVGNVVISTAQSKFGGASTYFDGVSDALVVQDGNAIRMQKENFTIEFWVYPTSLTGKRVFFSKGISELSGVGSLALYCESGNGLIKIYSDGNTLITASTALLTNTWQHVALVRESQNLTLYINGISVGSAVNETNFDDASLLTIGGYGTLGTTGSILIYDSMIGYMDDFCMTKGVARYKGNYTPPTLAFSTSDSLFAKIVLLLNMNGTNNSNVFTNTSTAKMLSWKRCVPTGFILDRRTGGRYDPYSGFYDPLAS